MDKVRGASGDHKSETETEILDNFIAPVAWKLHKAVAETNGRSRNFALSPVTVASSVFAVFLGADGATKEELNQFLNVGSFGEDQLCGAFLKHFQSLAALGDENNNNSTDDKVVVKEPTVGSSQRLFHSTGDRLLSDYIQAIGKLECQAQQVDFLATAHAFRKMVQWLENVGNTLSPAEVAALKDELKLEPVSRLFFLSSMHFSRTLDLKLAYSKENAFFQVNATKRVAMKMLCTQSELKYAVFAQLDARGVAIPYEGGRFSLWLFLPKGKEGLIQLEHGLGVYRNGKAIAKLFDESAHRKLHFCMPHFNVQSNVNMMDALKLLGASSMFDMDTANFGRLEESAENSHVSGILQNVHMQVHPQDAVNAAEFDLKSKHDEDAMEFHVEHPFFFVIYDQILEMVAVTGRIVNPLED